ncbi:MAG: chorismate--pyruvate lyase family protein [Burkholderiales bacterium]
MKLKTRPSEWPRQLTEYCGRHRPWLLDQGSLTRRVRAHFDGFAVRHVRQQVCRADADPAIIVRLGNCSRVMLRDVYLYAEGHPRVYAHSVLPLASLRGAWHALCRLGTRPLGEALFTNPRARRTGRAYKKVNRSHELYRRACAMLDEKPVSVWARGSFYSLDGRPILVIEVFLPLILDAGK